MLNRKDWLISFMSNLLFIVILILVMYKTGILYNEEKKEWFVELASSDSLPAGMRLEKQATEEAQIAIPEARQYSLPETAKAEYTPEKQAVKPTPPDRIDWSSTRIETPDMPADPFLNFDDPYIESDSLLGETSERNSSNNQSWAFSWNDGNERSIQYIPPWDYYVNKEISHGLDRLVLIFEISPEGYVSNVSSQEELSLNEAWFTLVENWLSRMVFEPGQEGQGSLTLIFENNSL